MTKPVEDILPLPMDTKVQQYMDFYHDALHELVCFGTHILKWSLYQGKSKVEIGTEIDMAAPLLFRHILELIDAISVQIKAGVAVPCKVHLRALLEAYLSLEYMLEKDRTRRAACFMIVDRYRQLSYYRRLTPGTKENEAFKKDLENFGPSFKGLSTFPEAGPMLKSYEQIVALPIYKDVRKEYLELVKAKPKAEIKWYSLFQGPVSVLWLAKKLKKLDWYESFYKSWSNPIHGTGLSTNVLVRGKDGLGAMIQIRNMTEAHEVVTQTALLTSMLYVELMAFKVVPEYRREISEWFQRYQVEYRTPLETRKINFT